MIDGGLEQFRGKRVLLLQGPIGPFFQALGRDLAAHGADVFKINFNGGDCLFYPLGAAVYRGRMRDWPAYLEHYVTAHQIDGVLLFGDCRLIHLPARALAAKRGLQLGVFEEGYVRPDYVTFECAGVNHHSPLPRDAGFYQALDLPAPAPAMPVRKVFGAAAWKGIAYYAASIAAWPFFRHYRHHRPLDVKEGLFWLRSYWRKRYYARAERHVQPLLSGPQRGQYFLLPLQVAYDAQVRDHSHYQCIASFISEVVASFAAHAPQGTWLAIKHHPMDRGHHDYARHIRQQAAAHGVADRVLYLHDQHLPTLLEQARGVVTINSTVGLSALHHGTPTKVCGKALYDMRGLTFQGGLDAFWQEAEQQKVDADLYRNFLAYLIDRSQLNGNFYKRLAASPLCCGLMWRMSSQMVATASETVSDAYPLLAGKAA